MVRTYGWKHFFGFNDLSGSDDTLFIGIVRNLDDWINSLYRERHHLPADLTKNIDCFLNGTFYSIDGGKEIMTDRNMETGERYKNIFELRKIKNKFLISQMPKLAKHYILITYDELVGNFIGTMSRVRDMGLEVKVKATEFPLNITYYKKNRKQQFVKKTNNQISSDLIRELTLQDTELLEYEAYLFPRK
jgi:hypothetical protein